MTRYLKFGVGILACAGFLVCTVVIFNRSKASDERQLYQSEENRIVSWVAKNPRMYDLRVDYPRNKFQEIGYSGPRIEAGIKWFAITGRDLDVFIITETVSGHLFLRKVGLPKNVIDTPSRRFKVDLPTFWNVYETLFQGRQFPANENQYLVARAEDIGVQSKEFSKKVFSVNVEFIVATKCETSYYLIAIDKGVCRILWSSDYGMGKKQAHRSTASLIR
jgi:hypothetical protein